MELPSYLLTLSNESTLNVFIKAKWLLCITRVHKSNTVWLFCQKQTLLRYQQAQFEVLSKYIQVYFINVKINVCVCTRWVDTYSYTIWSLTARTCPNRNTVSLQRITLAIHDTQYMSDNCIKSHNVYITHCRDPLLLFLLSIARRLLGERINNPTGKPTACLEMWLLLRSSEIISTCVCNLYKNKSCSVFNI